MANPYQSPAEIAGTADSRFTTARNVFFAINMLIAAFFIGLGALDVVRSATRLEFYIAMILLGLAVPYAILECVGFFGRYATVERLLGLANLTMAILPALGVVAFVIGSFTQDDPRLLPSLTWRISVGTCFAISSAYFILSGWSRVAWFR